MEDAGRVPPPAARLFLESDFGFFIVFFVVFFPFSLVFFFRCRERRNGGREKKDELHKQSLISSWGKKVGPFLLSCLSHWLPSST